MGIFDNDFSFGVWTLAFRICNGGHSACRGRHSYPEKSDEGIKTVFLGGHDEAAAPVGKKRRPRGFAGRARHSVGGLLRGGSVERDKSAGERIVGGERFTRRQREGSTGFVHPEAQDMV